MQFQLKTQVFGVNKIVISSSGQIFCSVFTGQPTANEETTKGLDITKLSADPVVFEQMPDGFIPGDSVEFIATLRRAAEGKSQPYLIGVVPNVVPATTGASTTQAKQAPSSTNK